MFDLMGVKVECRKPLTTYSYEMNGKDWAWYLKKSSMKYGMSATWGNSGCVASNNDRGVRGACEGVAATGTVAGLKLMMEDPPASELLMVETPPDAMRLATWRSRSA
jgi:hypothetical protein